MTMDLLMRLLMVVLALLFGEEGPKAVAAPVRPVLPLVPTCSVAW